MIIYADIRPLIVTGIVLLFTNFGWNYPLPLKRKLQVPGKRMIMTKKSCQDPIGNKGTCMFKYDCIRQKGVTLSTCVDGFLFGACCFLKEDSIQIISDGIYSEPTQLIDYQGQTETIYNFYKIESNVSLNNSTEYFSPVAEILTTSFNIFSEENFQENASTSLPDLFHSIESNLSSTVDLYDNENNFTTFKNILKPIYKNTDNISSAITSPNLSKLSVSGSTTFFTRLEDHDEESVINKKSSLLDPFLPNGAEINNTKVLPSSLSPTEAYPVPTFESSEKNQFEEYRSQLTNISNFDDNRKENNTADINNYWNEKEENENSTAFNRNNFSDLNPTDVSSSSHESFLQNISIPTEKTFELNETEELITDNLNLANYNMSIQPSEPPESYMVSSSKINFPPISENTTSEIHNTSVYENSINLDKNIVTESTQNTTVLSSFETPSIQTNSELFNLELTLIMSSVPYDNSKSNEFDQKDLLNTSITSSNLGDFDNKQTKLSNDSAVIFNSNSSNCNMTLDDKRTTKTVLPTLSWSSHSILPESFQSVISQLTEQEISSPGNFILDYEAHATPEVEVNTLVDQSLFPDSEESVKIEFKSQNISGFLDDKNIFIREFVQVSNTELSEADNFTSTSLNSSSVGLNDTKSDDMNKNVLMIPNVLIQDLTKNEINVKLIENLNNDDVSSKDELEIIPEEYYTNDISQTVEGYMHGSEGEKTVVDASTSSLDRFTEENNIHTKLLESNLYSHRDEVLLSAQTEQYKFKTNTTVSQDSYNQEKHHINLLTFEELDQNFTELSTSFPNVQSQSLNDSLYNTTEISATLTDEPTTDSYPPVIQIINNHIGKNSSANDLSNHKKDINESHESTIHAQSEENEAKGSTNSTVNMSSENSTNLYETETVANTYTPVIQNVVDSEESHQDDSSVYPVVNTDTLNFFNESLDSSQTTSFERISSHADFNSTSTFPSILINNSTSPFSTIVQDETKDTEFHSTDLEVHNSTATDGQSNESIDDSYNFINTEDELPTGFENYSDRTSDLMTIESKPTSNLAFLNYTDESSADNSFLLNITTELGYTETSVFTSNNPEISETVSQSVLTTLSNMSTWADIENPTLSFSSKPTDLNVSGVSITTSITNTIPSSTSTNTATTQSLDFLTTGDAFSNTLHEYSVVHSTGNTTLSTILTSKYPIIQDEETINVDKLTNLSTQTYSTSVSATTVVTKVNIHRWNYKKDCGVRLMQPVGRIVGGKNTYFGKWPWQALVKEATWLGLFVKNKCGGVLITSKYVLTAAHCQPGFFASLLVVLGTHDLAETFDNKASIIRNIKRMVVHRHYNAQTFENDLALLEMEAPVEFLPYVVPICLPHRYEEFTAKMAFVTGWGKLTAGGDVPNILQEVQVPILSNGECQSMFYQAGHDKEIRSNFVCAGYTNGGQDSCEGDSGGPLMVQREDTRWVLVGTVSHGIGCADPNLPGVYMRMSSYRPWIDSIIYK